MTAEEMKGYVGMEELYARAREQGARKIASALDGLVPGTEYWKATATVVTADGREYSRTGVAKPGDGQGEADEDTFPAPARAEKRALAATLRAAYGESITGAQEPHVRRGHQIIRETATKLGLPEEKFAERVRRRFHLASRNDLTPDQLPLLEQWCQNLVEGRALVEEIGAEEEAAHA